MRRLRWPLAITAVVWPPLIAAAPFLPTALAGFLYLFGSIICHQRAERSFHWGASQWLVCARCTGLYAGAAVGTLAWAAWPHTRRWSVSDDGRSTPRRERLAAAVFAVPTAATLAVEWLLWNPGNVTRAAAAVPLGIFGAWWTLHRVGSQRALD